MGKEKPQDCSLFSDNNFEFPIHKELFFQTKFMCEMIENVNYLESCCSKIEILCPSLAQKDLEMIVKFLYTGKIICENEDSACEVSKNLTNLFGFPSINKDGSSATKMEFYQKPESRQTQNSSSEQKTLEPTIEGKRLRKQTITSKSNGNNCPEIDIKQEIPSFDDDYDEMKYECGENEENNEEIQSSYPDVALKEEEEEYFQVK